MTIDRKRFLALALGMSLGACGGGKAGDKTMPSNTGGTGGAMTQGGGGGGGEKTMDDLACNGYDPTNECVSWNDGTVLDGYAPTSECVRWTPTNECDAWAYDPTGEGGPTSEVY